jgi:hypothetical protein
MAEDLSSANGASVSPEGQTQTSEGTAPQKQEAKQEAKVNLFDLPEFKGYQAKFNQTVSALQAQVAQLTQAQQQAQMAGMDDLEKANYLLQQKDAQLAELQRAMEAQTIQAQRWTDITELSNLTGAPTDVMAEARNYEEAVKASIKWMKENGATAQEVKEARAEANKVDLGGGGASTPMDREAKERQDLLKRGDTRGLFLKILGE